MIFLPRHVLAAAYAEAGQFKDAAKTLKEFTDELRQANPLGQMGLTLFNPNGEKELKARIEKTNEWLELYRSGKPLRIEK